MWKPTFLAISTITETIYYDSDNSLWLWKDPTSGNWTISATLLPQLDVDGDLYVITDYRTYEGQLYYRYSVMSLWSYDSKWAISERFEGTSEYWYWNDDDDHSAGGGYAGDAWWSNGIKVGSYLARGAGRGHTQGGYEGTPKVVTVPIINGWESATKFNEYDAIAGGGASGKKYVGWKKLTGDNGLADLTATDTIYNGEYVFIGDKILWYDGANWIINSTLGIKNSTVGYWQGGTPPIPSATTTVYTLVYTGDPPDPTPPTYTLTFDSYVEGNATSEEIQGQVAVWL